MTDNSQKNQVRFVAGNALMFLPGLFVIASELLKFLHVSTIVRQMAGAGFSEGKLLLVATLGSSSAVLFLYRRTRPIGLLLLSAFLGGAICLHVQRSEFANALAPALLLALAWIGTYLRHPAMLEWAEDRGCAAYLRREELGPGRQAMES